MTVAIERTSVLAASADVVWRHATSMAGVNAELSPIVMTYPPGLAQLPDLLAPDDPRLGLPLFTSVLKVGAVPFDRHRLTLVDVVAGRSFQEDSTSLLHRRWQHHREVVPAGDGCRVTDRVAVEPRIPGAAPLTRWFVGRIFDRRHRFLRTTFGEG